MGLTAVSLEDTVAGSNGETGVVVGDVTVCPLGRPFALPLVSDICMCWRTGVVFSSTTFMLSKSLLGCSLDRDECEGTRSTMTYTYLDL